MALFPAFAGLSNIKNNNENSPKELDWLSNQSFRTDDALVLHQLAVEKAVPEELEALEAGLAVQAKKKEDEEGVKPKRSKKKKKQKKKETRLCSRRKCDRSESSGCESDTVYPSDLLRQASDACRSNEELIPAQGSFIWLDDLRTPTDRPFCLDRKPDLANWEYKSLYRGDVPRYRRKGNSSLGLNPRMQSVSWTETGALGKKRPDKKPARYFSRGSRQQLNFDALPTLPSSKGLGRGLDTSSFIPVSPCTKDEGEKGVSAHPGHSWVNPLGVYDHSTSLWLQGKGQTEVCLQEGQGPCGATVEEGRDSANLLAATVEDFNKRLRENPSDIPTWLEFVRFQDKLIDGPFLGSEGEVDKRRKSLRMTLEKKVCILERAMESNPGSVELKLARLQLCRELWEPAVLLKEWKKLVFLHPNDPCLWRRYLLYIQSQFSTFTVSKVNAVFGKCLSTLAAVQDGCMVSHPALPGTEEAMLAIFLQQCHFLRQAGYSEKAISLFQAMLDFTFFKPDSVKDLPTRQQVEFFEPFWDSGEPRIGERGARGWKAWMHQQERGGWIIPNEPDDDDDNDEQDDTSVVKDKTWPKWKIWLDVEAAREANHWLPWRPDKTKAQSEEDCEDPDRQVLFDDLGPSIIRLQQPELRFRLVCSFLEFLGLPGEGYCFSDPSWSILLDDLSILDEYVESRRLIGLCKPGEEFLQHISQQISPLLSAQEKSMLSLYLMRYEKLKVLRCIQSKNKKKVKSQGRRSKRLAKRLLKELENRNELALWQEYAHLEWLLGNLEEARKVFDVALGLGVAGGLQDPALCELCLLYAQLEVETAHSGATTCTSSPAVYILTKLAEGGAYSPFTGQVSPVAVLKARRSYEQGLAGQSVLLVGLVGCFILFQYLTVGIEAAEQVYNQVMERLKGFSMEQGEQEGCNMSSQRESLALMWASLFSHHANVSICPLGRLRDTLTNALSSFPGNCRLWQLYLQAECRYHAAGRSRRFFHHLASHSASVVPRLFAIRAEQSRKQLVETVQRNDYYGEVLATLPETGLSHRIRVLFENAVASEHGTHCPLLWRMYLNFLVSEGSLERGRGMFYKALQDIPWVKGLYMDAVQLFPDHVQEFLDLMMEKELRLRLPMEEVDILLED